MNTKKIIAIAVAVILIFAVAIAYYIKTSKTEEKATEDSETTESQTTESVDYDSIYKLHDPDEVVMTVDGRDVTWAEYFYWYYDYAEQVEQMITYAPLYYGTEMSWDDICDETTGQTYADIPAAFAEEQSKLYAGVYEYAEQNGIDFDEDCEEKYQETIDSNVTAAGLTSEDELFNQLEQYYVSRTLFDTQVKASILNEKAYIEKYGVDGADISDEEAIQYQEDNNYMHVMHILFRNKDAETSEELTEDQLAEKKAQAEELVKELNAITNNEERVEKFKALAEEYNEDGKSEYTFTEGEMVTEFETAAKELKEYQVELVETQYGYHIIMKLPLDANAELTNGNKIKTVIADEEFEEILENFINNLSVEYKDNFEAPVITDYIVKK